MKKRVISMLLIGASLALVGCGDSKELTSDKVNLSADKEVSEDGSYVVVIDLEEGIEGVDYTLTENGLTIDSQENVNQSMKEKVMSNKSKGDYNYVLTVKDEDGKSITKEIAIKVSDSIATSGGVSQEGLSKWSGEGIEYKVDDKVSYDNKQYKCLQGHTSQEDWIPTSASSLWKEIK